MLLKYAITAIHNGLIDQKKRRAFQSTQQYKDLIENYRYYIPGQIDKT